MTAAPSLEPAFALRVATPLDAAFILDSWGRCEADCRKHEERWRFDGWQQRMMREILSRESTRAMVASPVGDDAIAGWAVTAPGIVYYVFVRTDARQLGIATMLLDDIASSGDVIYCARPAKVRDGAGWASSPVRIPKAWRYSWRANFYGGDSPPRRTAC